MLPGIEIKGQIEGFMPEGEWCTRQAEALMTIINDFTDWFVTRGIASYYRDGDFEEIKGYGEGREVSIFNAVFYDRSRGSDQRT